MKKFFAFLFIIIIVAVVAFLIYTANYYKADVVNRYLITNNNITVEKISNGYFFDGPGEDSAVIFYPGAKVEYTAYAPLMFTLASNGVDTFLLKMPFNIAFFGTNRADKVISKYNYENWYIGGHSLGGVVASKYANNNSSKVKGIILLASYSTVKINDNLKLLSLYGNQDNVLNLTKYEENKVNFPSNFKEEVLKGANHSNFGNYGNQKGDGTSLITKEEQQTLTVEEIINFINN